MESYSISEILYNKEDWQKIYTTADLYTAQILIQDAYALLSLKNWA